MLHFYKRINDDDDDENTQLNNETKPRKSQGWAQGSFVEAEVKAAMSLTEERQGRDRGRGRELEAMTFINEKHYREVS